MQYVDDFVDPGLGPFVVMQPLCREALLDRVERAGKARAAGRKESLLRQLMYEVIAR